MDLGFESDSLFGLVCWIEWIRVWAWCVWFELGTRWFGSRIRPRIEIRVWFEFGLVWFGVGGV